MDPTPEPLPSAQPPAATYVPPPKVPWYSWRRLGLNFLTISLLIHLLLGVGAAYFVVSVTYPKKKSFAGGAPAQSASHKAVEHKVSMAKAQQRSSAPATAKRVTTTGASKVALPTMSSMPMDGAVVPVSMSGMGGAGIGGFGGPGGGSAGGGGGGPSFFGLRSNANSGALVGTFYDLKQTKEGQPTSDMNADIDAVADPHGTPSPARVAYGKTVGTFIKNGIFENSLSRFFKGPSPLYTKMIFIPRITADDGPKAFNLEKLVKPRRWLAFYHGQVIAPESGRFRFAGICDDVLAVRFNNTIALDGSLANYSGLQNNEGTYKYDTFHTALHVGQPFNVAAGGKYPIDVVIGEDPGGVFYAFLVLEKIGEKYDMNGGSPVLPLFKVGAAPTPAFENKPGDSLGDRTPPLAPDTSWSVWKIVPESSL